MGKAGSLVALLLVALAAGWSCLWLYAAREASVRTDAWIAAEQVEGRTWTCPNRKTGGYPFALSISCDDPTYVGQAMGQQVEAKLARLEGDVTLTHPRVISLTLQPPFSFRSSDGGTAVKATWQALAVSLGTLPDIDSLSLKGTAVAVDGAFGPMGRGASGAKRLDAHFAFQPGAANATLAFDVAVEGTAVPSLDALLGATVPTDVALAGRLDHASIGAARTPEEALERWRQAGGRIDLASSRVRRAGASVSASGTLRLDEAHRVAGRLDAEFVGLEPILARYGISGNLAAVGSLVSTLFGGAPPKAPPRPGALDLPISFRNGRLGVGPITTNVRLTPLY